MEVAHEFKMTFKFAWTDDYRYLKLRGKLGIEWDDLPAMAIDTDKIGTPMFMYPKGLPFKKNHIEAWLWSSFKDNNDEDYMYAA